MESTSLTHLHIKKGYVQRDYSRGTKIKFETTLPSELENVISQEEFTQFIEHLNEIYFDAERLKFCEGCLACMTAYLLYCCIETHKQKCMRKASEFIDEQNEVWKDRGITVFDPFSRGFRILEIQVHSSIHVYQPQQPQSQPGVQIPHQFQPQQQPPPQQLSQTQQQNHRVQINNDRRLE